MVLGDDVSTLETFVWILNHVSRSITWFLFALKAWNLVKWLILTWSFIWWGQFIDWLQFETRPSSPLNFGMAYCKTLSILNLEKVATSNLKDLLKMDQNTIAKIVHLHYSIIIDKLWLKMTDCYFSWKFPWKFRTFYAIHSTIQTGLTQHWPDKKIMPEISSCQQTTLFWALKN